MISALIYTAISCESLMSSIISQFSLETTSNPFESNESTFLSTDSKATERRKHKKTQKADFHIKNMKILKFKQKLTKEIL
jgi:hypothetical protein